MEKFNMEIGGKKISLDIVYDCYEGEVVTEDQKEALELFAETKCYENTTEKALESYIKENAGQNVSESDILKYVTPKDLYICRDEKIRRIAIMCDTVFDEEHGTAILFRNEKCVGMIEQDEVL